MLAESGPRYVSADREFAVWSATIGESSDGEPVTLAGPLGEVTAGERLVCSGVFSQHPRYGWQFAVETFRSALPQSREGIVLWLTTRVPGIGPAFAQCDRPPLRRGGGVRRARQPAGAAAGGADEIRARDLEEERRARDRGVAGGGDRPRGRDVPVHARDQRRPRRQARPPLRRRGRRRADAGSVSAGRAAAGRLQDRGPGRALARRRAGRSAAVAGGSALRARGGGDGRKHVLAADASSGRAPAACSEWGSSIRSSLPCVRSSRRTRSSSRASGSIGSTLGAGVSGRGDRRRAGARSAGRAVRRSGAAGRRGFGRAVGGRRAGAHAAPRAPDRPSGCGQDAHAARRGRDRQTRAQARAALCADWEGGAADARPDRARRDDDPSRARLLADGGRVPPRRALAALERLRPDHRRRGIDALARARRRALPRRRRLSRPARRRHGPAAADRRRARARRSRRMRRRPARPSHRDLPAGGALADHPERPPDQRGRAAVPFARRSSRNARRRMRSSTRTSSSSRVTAPPRCSRPSSSSSANASPPATGSIREPR